MDIFAAGVALAIAAVDYAGARLLFYGWVPVLAATPLFPTAPRTASPHAAYFVTYMVAEAVLAIIPGLHTRQLAAVGTIGGCLAVFGALRVYARMYVDSAADKRGADYPLL